ncbi:MAG: hypothetical protein M1833_003914 [Piccolia ochrophora]|nr:MAG: hypothetical protein M1833_003914 [Piccolia ochrophora]
MTPNPASPSPAGPNPSAPPDPMRITAAQPRDYWAGRFSALADRFRAEEANGMVAEGDGAGEARVADQDERRKERAMRALEAVCAGVEARGSLMEFQRALERRARLCAQKSSGSEEKGFRRWFKGRKSGA